MSSSFNGSSNIDNILLQNLLGRLQIRPPNSPLLSQSLDDLFFKPDDSSDEEARLEKELIRIIVSGRIDSLKANSGQAVTVNEHQICVEFHEDEESEYRVWGVAWTYHGF
ncbi:unnamed protein product [Eruca vesicaria subsp. sativa]|uniref:Uncharacterized protein n=1 Tax=Eruca vesicaria subsp. sativa TaxID=29727 RepID=A0ABC8LGV6_ERUVS|nr:unnamed protein product [Eruca vesicaria subsp. sativa]